ncbi:5'-3' exonuclease, C-terminal domain-containing protein [Cynara cardunculus var. scolymus]|uniref:5'-3' exonuclease, C-terminal domain-containing protein n=1 Tax=Cynara cardunculus var. scolymus TaxID=59895 RepID=A0A118JT80_CYNCS|nr:5'-3' exonuclease, C-terminal domain-containing protein [Cynara cardunculus var. scolymus]
MGIQGLLPLLKSIMVPIHMKDLEGCSVAVDTYSWLHKGALSCSKELCNLLPTSKYTCVLLLISNYISYNGFNLFCLMFGFSVCYIVLHVDYCMHRVNLLRHYGIKPVLVFDGGHLPMKNEQEIKRARSRKENLVRAIEHDSCGNASAAYECYQKAVDISPAIAYELIQLYFNVDVFILKVLKQENISYVVAPYEADAQMTFLAISKHVDAVITEDSDLIPFGCPRIIYKMDKFGQGVEFQHSKLQHNKDLNLTGFTKQMILEMCILSGCDYLQSLPGMGLKKANALIKKFKSYDKVIKHLKFSGIAVPLLYEESFRKAIMTFQHQRVYDPLTEDIVHLSDLSDNIDEDLDFLGPYPCIAILDMCLKVLSSFDKQGESVKAEPLLDGIYNLKSFKSGDANKRLDLPAQKNLLTNYFCILKNTCFASLEAKRKFRAPRVSPKHSTPTNATPQIDICEEIVDTIAARKTSMLLELPSHDDKRNVKHSKHPIHPCIASQQKDLESNSSFDAIDGKTRVQKKTVVRSCYFQHKNVEENDLANTKTNPSVCDDEVTVVRQNPTSDGEPKSGLGSAEVKTRVENRKTNVSRYFSHINQETTNERHVETNNYEGSTMKRKFSNFEDGAEKENMNQKYMRASRSPADQGLCTSELDQMQVTKDKEEKFGCDISHLGKYSDIAEKSMDRFISVISSFSCTSSGSRASGLRAPLKDVRNTFTKKSSCINDITKFAYTPRQTKPLPSQRP